MNIAVITAIDITMGAKLFCSLGEVFLALIWIAVLIISCFQVFLSRIVSVLSELAYPVSKNS